ncbi:MAG: hypothetical protein ACREIU_08445 [Planctomycetota bacterium]
MCSGLGTMRKPLGGDPLDLFVAHHASRELAAEVIEGAQAKR